MSGTSSAILRDNVSIGGFQDLNATCQRPLLQNNWIVQSFQNYYTISNGSENSWAILWPTSLAAVCPHIDTTNYLPCLDMFGASLQAESWVTLLPIATHLLAGIRPLRFVTQKFHEISICWPMLATKMSWDAEPQPDKPTSPSLNSNGSSNFRLSRKLVHLLTEMPWPYHLGTDNPIRSWMRGLWLGKKYKGTAVSISTTIEMHATTFKDNQPREANFLDLCAEELDWAK